MSETSSTFSPKNLRRSPERKSDREAGQRQTARANRKSKYRKASTPPSMKSRSYSPSSSGDEYSADDFPIYRDEWDEKSPSQLSTSSASRDNIVERIDTLLKAARTELGKLK
ncbi:MAG: hypothetical protein MKZ63_08475 [Nitrospinales bacterium]|nr:hypothetical protein [Nitrospinales bacterium]